MVCLFGNPHPFARIPPASAVPFQDFWTYASWLSFTYIFCLFCLATTLENFLDFQKYAGWHGGAGGGQSVAGGGGWWGGPRSVAGGGGRGADRVRNVTTPTTAGKPVVGEPTPNQTGSSRSGGGSGGDGGCHCAAHAAGDAAGDAGVAVHVAVFVAVAVTVAVAVAVAAGTAVCCSVAGEEEEEVQRRVSDALRGQTRSTVTGFCVAPSILPLLTTFVPSGTGGNTPPLDP
ncbi:hypothetical protein HL42_2928 [Trichophyton rubrum]|nr:hypothetical protein HL42_2928 [Trichophyton rubrum]